jgi:hypothetical protein
MSWEQGAAIAGVIGGALVLIQIGDRLWRSKGNGKVQQSPECHFEHCQTIDSNRKLESAMERMAIAQAALLETVKSQCEIARLRHEEVMREIVK